MTITIDACGKSKAAFGRSIGCERGRVHDWTKGAAYPDVGKILEMHRVYGITPDWLLLGRIDSLPARLEAAIRAREARSDG